jgi:hypothetical protein
MPENTRLVDSGEALAGQNARSAGSKCLLFGWFHRAKRFIIGKYSAGGNA